MTDLTAVSYTHLDVYKRQGQVVPAINIYGLCRSLGIEHVCEVDAFDPVSYTHLDVYKRQRER